MQFHPVANIFPMMQPDEYEALVEDIQANGLLEPIWTHEGFIIDGRNRWRACQEAGVAPTFREWNGQGSLVAFVVSLNLKRRHLNSGQRAVLALEIKKQLAVEAKLNLQSAGQSHGRGQEKPFPNLGNPIPPVHATREAAKVAGVSHGYVSDATKIEREAPELLEMVRDDRLSLQDAKKLAKETIGERKKALDKVETGQALNVKDAIRKTRLEKQIASIETFPVPKGKFRVIVADPPWRYNKRAEDVTHRGACPYPTMDTLSICALSVEELAHDDCILWLWTTNAFMEAAYQVARAWGFEVKTVLTWAKDRMGVGDWLRGQTEHCLMAIRGKPVVVLTNQTTLLNGPLREHSRKPGEFYALVDALCPGNKCELFAREKRPGWESFGAEIGALDG